MIHCDKCNKSVVCIESSQQILFICHKCQQSIQILLNNLEINDELIGKFKEALDLKKWSYKNDDLPSLPLTSPADVV